MRHNVKVPIVHLWSKFGYNWSEPVRTGAIWKRLTKTLTDGHTEFGSLCVSTNIRSGDTKIVSQDINSIKSIARYWLYQILASPSNISSSFWATVVLFTPWAESLVTWYSSDVSHDQHHADRTLAHEMASCSSLVRTSEESMLCVPENKEKRNWWKWDTIEYSFMIYSLFFSYELM